MNALICTIPGNFEYKKIAEPVPAPGNSIIKIKRVGVCGTDLHAYEGTQPYFSYPRILGHEIAAEIVQTDAPGFSKSDIVTLIPYFNCGKCVACRNGKPNCCVSLKVSGVHIDGAMVEYLSVPSYSLVHSKNISSNVLALVEPLAIGAHGIRRANPKEDEFVLVIGAGPIGLGVMEFAKIAGARVIAMDVNKTRLQFCGNEMGIEYLVDATSPDHIEKLMEITNGEMPTVVLDATGNLKAIQNGFNYLAHGGRYVLVGLQKENISISHPEFHKREATLMSSRNATREDFEKVISSISEKKIDPAKFITHQVAFEKVRDEFPKWLKPETKVIKAIIEIN
ncbi:MAG: alcohol dehydrogenase [Bacteroidetes bacterium]|nr:MAG: alcohol dehydrogenase [Bacteroidota bacterium]